MAGKNAFSPAIDIYAFGAILYRLLVGKKCNRQGWPGVTESISESATKVINAALDPSPGKHQLGSHVKKHPKRIG